MRFQGKTALVTGATTGIGFATARRLLDEGVEKLVITGQDEERLEAAREDLSGTVPVLAWRWRAERTADSVDLAERVGNELGSLDVLIANAGVTWPAPLGSIDPEQAQAQLLVNVVAPLYLVQGLSPLMREGGSIVMTSSCLDVLGMPGMAVYSASKAALRSLVRTLSAELKDRGIRVNSVAPGPVETPIYSKLGMSEAELGEMAAGIVSQVPLGRFGRADEIASAIAFLASTDSSYMLGEEIRVDGGWASL